MILVCLARSSAEFTGDDIFDAVKKAATNIDLIATCNGGIMVYIPAKFAVYEETMMRVKNHHMPATILVEIALVVMFLNKVMNCETNDSA